ncbi:MAG: argininosuccinate lyase, partial [Solirubrobacteraceae bacterium]
MSRFAEPQHPVFRQLNSSIGFDWRLGPYDIEQSRAHATMLAATGIISDHDRDALLHGLDRVAEELDEGAFRFDDEDEDIHMAVERRLTEIVGPVGGKLHTARSRNDQVATDVAMFTRAHALQTLRKLQQLQSVIVQLAARHEDWAMPGYTHLQRAQPVYLSHHLLAYFWMFRRDASRFEFVLGATAELPLGAGALAGVNFPTDRQLVARELGFAQVARNSIDAVSNRDFVLDFLSAAATCATHLSRLGAEIVLWSSEEFGFCQVSDAWASGSSIMPQKKNPDAAELLRAKAPRVASRLGALHGVMHGLPLTYNKDMQEDKEHLFDAVDTLELCLQAARGMLSGIEFRRDARRFEFVLGSTNDLPLGAGALAGVNFPTDRRLVASELGFAGVVPNSIDAVSNRDFVLDYLGAAATAATHLSRLGAELVLWSSEEFGFAEVADAWASGSSIMPQKKNPDAAELLRAKAPRVVAHLSALHGVMHGLPLTYNKDMQEDKEHLFDATDTLDLCLQAARGMLSTITFRREALSEAASDEMIAATDVADLLVRRGIPFRQSHGIVAGLVRTAVESGRTLSQLEPAELTRHSEVLDDEFYAVLSQQSWLESKVSEGGTSLARV